MNDEFKEFGKELNNSIPEFKEIKAIEYYAPKEAVVPVGEIALVKEDSSDEDSPKDTEQAQSSKDKMAEQKERLDRVDKFRNTDNGLQEVEAESAASTTTTAASTSSTTAASTTSSIVSTASLTTGLTVISAAAIIATGGIGGAVFAPKPTINSASFETGSDYLVYELDVDVPENYNYKIKVSNDSFTETYPIEESGVQRRIVSGLIPDRAYDVEIICTDGNFITRTFYSHKCYTDKIKMPAAVFNFSPVLDYEEGIYSISYEVFLSDYYDKAADTFLQIYESNEMVVETYELEDDNYFRGELFNLGNNTELKKVQITLEETNDVDQAIIISIEDSGLGIKDAGEALTLGKAGSDTVLNEHGFGLIQALSAANKENDAWEIYNRSPENKANHEIMHIKAPYVMGKQIYPMEPDSNWTGHEWGSTLLIVRCNFKLFENLIPAENAVRTSLRFDFHSVADRIYEDLGFTYASLLEDNKVEMNLVLRYFNGKTEEHTVTAVTPLWSKKDEIENKKLHLKCTYGQIATLPDRIPFNNQTSSRYYKGNITSSGAEIRINGRVMEYNKFEEIYGKKNHPMYNSVLIQVDIVSDSKEYLPATRTTKNGFRVGDEHLTDIYKWLRKTVVPTKKSIIKPIKISEIEKKKKLARLIQNGYDIEHGFTLNPAGEIAVREYPVFKQILKKECPRVDIFVDDQETKSIIEAKKETASVIDIYQLLMYCDGYCLDNDKMPDEAILVAKSFPEGLKRVVEYLNKKIICSYPIIRCKYWDDYQENFDERIIEEKKLKRAV